ncbi:MarR family winged helix-turn-helix transcriptional regulator [Rhizobium alvei]|uniref:MarR family transcriptional regulator n=1 Tax=Rhizobium alvei TaxID=1132659 RepID=A0ABT8YQ17_9HYPH|nr:MarR family transcriptional regulator [Rhizobium alvei]MDO6965409.1 MarR family transcriptional regulator [Rhizobium alvei]
MTQLVKTEILTELLLTVFRINGKLLQDGDVLTAPLGLTSARWQVLGAIALSGAAQTVPDIAGKMGMTRQGAQKQVDRLQANGLLASRPNPRHKRSPLYALTDEGTRAYSAISERYSKWSEALSDPLEQELLEKAMYCLTAIEARLADVDPTDPKS